MSCVLRISAPDIEHRIERARVRPYRVDRGTAHYQVSGCEFEDLPGQVEDALAFLAQHAHDLERLLDSGVTGSLDFAVHISEQGFSTRRFPVALVAAAGALGLALDLSVYPGEAGHAV